MKADLDLRVASLCGTLVLLAIIARYDDGWCGLALRAFAALLWKDPTTP